MITLFIFLYLIITIHECSHALAVIAFKQEVKKIQLGAFSLIKFQWKYGVKTPFPVEIGLFPFIGFCSFDPKKLTAKQKIVVALAGPIGNIVTGGIGMLIYYMAFRQMSFAGILPSLTESAITLFTPFISLFSYIVHLGYVYAPIARSTASNADVSPLLQFSAISLSIAGFNLFPLFPLDGGHVLTNTYEAITKKEFPRRIKNVMLVVALFTLMIFPIVRLVIQLFR